MTILEIYQFTCESCGYESIHAVGYSSLDQVLTDVNLDYAEYRLYVCNVESRFVPANIHDKEFLGKCPHDNSALVEIKEIPPKRCPRCNHELMTKVSAPLEE
jgi:hypothetical protein